MYRIGRLWPVNILATVFASIVIGIGIYQFGNFCSPIPDWWTLRSFIATLFMVEQFNKQEIVFVWNQPAWTVSVELTAYIFFPFIALLIGRYVKRVGFYGSLLVTFLILAINPHFHIDLLDSPFSWVIRLMLGFMSGVSMAITFSKVGKRNLSELRYLHYILPLLVFVIIFSGLGIKYITPPLTL